MDTPTKPPRTRKTVPCGGKGRTQTEITKKSKLGNFLLVASIAKALSQTGGTRNLDEGSIPLSEDLILQVLRRNTLEVSKKVSFFKWCSLSSNYKHSAGAYSQIFQTVGLYCQRQHHLSPEIRDLLSDLLTSMKHDNIVLDSSTLKLLLDAFIRSGKYNFALEILDYVENTTEMGMPTSCLKHDLYNSVLVALVRKNQLGLALSIFKKLLDPSEGNGNGGGFVPDAITCNELFVGLRKADMKPEFKQVFDRLRDKNLFPLDTWGYNICIHAFGCWGDLATSLSLFKEMKEKSLGSCGLYSPDLCTYNSLIHVLCSVGKVKDALIVYEELKGSGHEPNAFTYRILIHGCSKSYRIYEASKIFSEMQYNGFRPDTVVYNSLLDGFLKARKLIDACQLFEKMIDDGTRASCWTYNILIDGLFRNGRPTAAKALFSDLKKKGQFVDTVTYSIVVQNICRNRRLEEALQLVEEMEARGFVVDLVTITSLLIALYRQGRWDMTERLMKHIRDGNLMPTVLKWKASMEASMKNPQSKMKDFKPIFPSKGDFTDILNLLSSAASSIDTEPTSEGAQWSSSPYMDMLADEVKVNPDDHSSHRFSLAKGKRVQEKGNESFDIDMVNTYLSIFLSKGKLSLACKLFEIFTDMGVESTSYTYNSMMNSFVKKGYFKEAWGVFQEMGEKVCPADIATYNVIIQGLGKMGKADIASAILDNLLEQGGYLDIVMYNTLINALGKAGRVDEANGLFEHMRTSGINPDVVTYNTMIEVHSKTGRLKDAYKFLKMMLDAGCPPNHVTDTTLDFLEKEIEKLRYQKASIKSLNKDDFS